MRGENIDIKVETFINNLFINKKSCKHIFQSKKRSLNLQVRPLVVIQKKFVLLVTPMIVLGIEGSANKLGVGIVRNEEILSNIRRTYCPANGEGFIPIKVSEHHRSNILDLIEESLCAAKLRIEDVDAFAYTRGPGIQQSLVVVVTVIRTLSILLNKPIIPVNHCIAHI